MSVYPYKFQPVYKEKIWGGRNLQRLFGRALPAGAGIGESWELADMEEGETPVANGPDAGRTLQELLKEKGGAILGRAHPLAGGRFPLLLKLLDANDILSLQVHPDAQAAARLGPPAVNKFECWYVIESCGGYIYKGVKRGVTADQFRQALAADDNERLKELVERIDVKAGDVHFLPGGVVHAIGPGVVVAEVQTPSDTIYRVSDWGRGRPIHVEQAMRCIRFEPPPPSGRGEALDLRSPYFSIRRPTRPAGAAKLPSGACTAWMMLTGRARLLWPGESAGLPVAPGDTILLPAALEGATLEVAQEMAYLEITLPN